MNFWIDKVLERGYKPTINRQEYNPRNNWFGVSRYHPDQVFVKGDNKIVMSLQGLYTPENPEHFKEHRSVWKAMGIKYIGVYIGPTLVWETYFGSPVPDEIIEKL